MSDKEDFEDLMLPYAEIGEPMFKQVPLTQEEADLMGEATIGLINSTLTLQKHLKDIPKGPLYGDLTQAITWAATLLANIEQQTAKAGLGMIP